MALVIEDGSLVANAAAFVGVAEVRAFAALRASIVPATGSPGDAEIECAIIKAGDFLEALRGQFRGFAVSASQSLCFPRSGIVLDGFELAQNVIPEALKKAQCQLAIEILSGVDLQPTGDGREIIREKLDVIETEYKPGAGGAAQPVLTKAMAFLAPLLSNGISGGLKVGRA